eukprot:1741619-Amphidinium_carterae.1
MKSSCDCFWTPTKLAESSQNDETDFEEIIEHQLELELERRKHVRSPVRSLHLAVICGRTNMGTRPMQNADGASMKFVCLSCSLVDTTATEAVTSLIQDQQVGSCSGSNNGVNSDTSEWELIQRL